MQTVHSDDAFPLAITDDPQAGHGPFRLLRAVLHPPRPRPRTAPVPADGRLRADLGLAPVPDPAPVAGCPWPRAL